MFKAIARFLFFHSMTNKNRARSIGRDRQAGSVEDQFLLSQQFVCRYDSSTQIRENWKKSTRQNSTGTSRKMRAISLNSRCAILRRQRDPNDVMRGSFGPKSRRNLSVGQSSSPKNVTYDRAITCLSHECTARHETLHRA